MGLPRVWSPFQGYAPWALEGLPRWGLRGCWSPIGEGCSWIVLCRGRGIPRTVATSSLLAVRWLRVASAGLLSFCGGLTQGLVALSGLRTLGFEGIAPLGLARLLVAYRGGVVVDCFVS